LEAISMLIRVPQLLPGIVLTLFFLQASLALAQTDVVASTMPPVPTTVSPVLQWLMGLATVLLSAFLPLVLLLLKQRFAVANASDQARTDAGRAVMLDNATRRAGALAYADHVETGKPLADAIATTGLNYMKTGLPETIAAVGQATDAHLVNGIKAEATALKAQDPAPLPAEKIIPAQQGLPIPAFLRNPSPEKPNAAAP
jgi:hypothetical protein